MMSAVAAEETVTMAESAIAPTAPPPPGPIPAATMPNASPSGAAPMPPSPDPASLPAVVDGIDVGTRPIPEEAWAALGSLTSRVTHAVRASVSEAARVVSAATAPRAPRAAAPRIVAVGDALVANADGLQDGAGWLALLRGRYGSRAHFSNYGADGYNVSVGARTLLRRALRDEAPVRIVLLAFGASDACKPPRHLPIDEFRLELAKMALAVLGSRASPILVTPSAVIDSDDLKSEDVKNYAAACRQVAAELQLPCVDLHAVMETRAADQGVKRYLRDETHLNEEGNKLLESLIVESFNSHFKSLAPDNLSEPFAPWTLLDQDSVTDSPER